MKIRKIDHVGIVVQNLPAAKAFFLALGMELLGEQEVGGEWVDRVVGLEGVQASIAMLGPTEGETRIELVKFHTPAEVDGGARTAANGLGIRHFTLVVEDVDAAVAKVREHGGELVREIVNYENVYKVCYVRGPEGIILELAQELD